MSATSSDGDARALTRAPHGTGTAGKTGEQRQAVRGHSRFAELDVFRGIAALVVVVYHYLFRFDQLYGLETLPFSIDWMYYGRYGVHFFFLISGFVIIWSLSNARGLADFLISRITRIYPAYWVALIATFGIVSIAGLPGREVGIGAFLVNFTMIQEYLGVTHVDRAYWTLTVELTFYFWIVIAWLSGQAHRAEFLLLPLMLLGALMHLGIIDIPWRLSQFLLLKHANLFAAGIVFFRLHQGTDRGTARWFLPLSAAINFAIYPWPDALFIGTFYLFFLLAVRGRLGWLCTRPLLWLGGISYSLYLLHQNIGYVIIRGVASLTGSEWLGIVGALLVILLMADALTRLVERPATRHLRRLAKARAAARA